jgi:hypothetical protein
MRISPEHYDSLGLQPGTYSFAEVSRCFGIVRARLLEELEDPSRHESARRNLDRAYRARNAFQATREQTPGLHEGESDRYSRMRRMIESSLEDGLLRCSRRHQVIAEGRRLGFSDFHTQLMIAQVQFGDRELIRVLGPDARRDRHSVAKIGAKVSAAGVLGLTIFLAMVRWLGV